MKSITHAQLIRLKRFTTPTLSNALESYEECFGLDGFNRDETRDFMPHLGPMIGYAVTAVYGASARAKSMKDCTEDLLRLIERSPKPVIVAVRDSDSPKRIVGALWGECFSNICQALGAVGTITDGAIRDYDEMQNVGFHALARRLCVSHAHGRITGAGKPIAVFGATVRTGDILHADHHGFLKIPPSCVDTLADTATACDQCELDHIISAARTRGFDIDKYRAACENFGTALAAVRGSRSKRGL